MSKQIKLSVNGMSCGHCIAAVEKSIAAVDGVEDAVVSLEEGTAVVSGTADADSLIAAITQAGYSATEPGG